MYIIRKFIKKLQNIINLLRLWLYSGFQNTFSSAHNSTKTSKFKVTVIMFYKQFFTTFLMNDKWFFLRTNRSESRDNKGINKMENK